jgi:NAD(P)-dependent dehydrogenase (short-subunit alcohol dehydrogenase family)
MTNALRVIVTAGGAGIGAAIATAFAADGCRVHVCDVNSDALSSLTEREPRIRTSELDVSNERAVERWLSVAVADLGGVDVLVNNAGIAGPTANVEDVDYGDWRRCLEVGLYSHFLTCRHLAPVMKQQRSGSIINISSTAGQVGYGQRTPYAAAKWAVIGLTKSLAIELGPFNVRVNAICPGAVSGDRMDRVIAAQAAATGAAPERIRSEITQGQSIHRFVEPEEIAAMCRFLASPGAAMVSGQSIAVDGHTETYHLA